MKKTIGYILMIAGVGVGAPGVLFASPGVLLCALGLWMVVSYDFEKPVQDAIDDYEHTKEKGIG